MPTRNYSNDAQFLNQLNGTPVYLGIIISAGGALTTNATTATPFTIPAGAILLLQSDAATYVLANATPTLTTGATGNGLKLTSDEKYKIVMTGTGTALQAIGAGAFNLKVFQLS